MPIILCGLFAREYYKSTHLLPRSTAWTSGECRPHCSLESFLIHSIISVSRILTANNDCVLGHISHFGGTNMTPPTPEKNCLTMSDAGCRWMGLWQPSARQAPEEDGSAPCLGRHWEAPLRSADSLSRILWVMVA